MGRVPPPWKIGLTCCGFDSRWSHLFCGVLRKQTEVHINNSIPYYVFYNTFNNKILITICVGNNFLVTNKLFLFHIYRTTWLKRSAIANTEKTTKNYKKFALRQKWYQETLQIYFWESLNDHIKVASHIF